MSATTCCQDIYHATEKDCLDCFLQFNTRPYHSNEVSIYQSIHFGAKSIYTYLRPSFKDDHFVYMTLCDYTTYLFVRNMYSHRGMELIVQLLQEPAIQEYALRLHQHNMVHLHERLKISWPIFRTFYVCLSQQFEMRDYDFWFNQYTINPLPKRISLLVGPIGLLRQDLVEYLLQSGVRESFDKLNIEEHYDYNELPPSCFIFEGCFEVMYNTLPILTIIDFVKEHAQTLPGVMNEILRTLQVRSATLFPLPKDLNWSILNLHIPKHPASTVLEEVNEFNEVNEMKERM